MKLNIDFHSDVFSRVFHQFDFQLNNLTGKIIPLTGYTDPKNTSYIMWDDPPNFPMNKSHFYLIPTAPNSFSEAIWSTRGYVFFPTCQVRVVRFYVSCLPSAPAFRSCLSCLPLPPPASSSSSSSNCDPRSTLFGAGPQPRPSTPSVPCRTSTTTIHAQCSLPDLNREYPRPVFPAEPQPRVSTPSVPCRTSTASIHAKCSLPDLM